MGWLSDFILSAGGIKVPKDLPKIEDPSEDQVGIHLFSYYGEEYQLVSDEVSESIVIDLLERLNWQEDFYQVIVTLKPGLSMEVGGSLNGIDGLCAVYQNHELQQRMVTSIAPKSVRDMVEIVRYFVRGDFGWKDLYRFE